MPRTADAARPQPAEDGAERWNETAAGLRAFFRIADLWGLGMDEARVLLGHPSRATVYNWRAGRVRTVPYDTVRRVSYVLGIYKALQILYADPALADGWVKRPNAAFGGRSALARMLGGDVADLAAVRGHLDAARGGWG
jgi:hypothetical protein